MPVYYPPSTGYTDEQARDALGAALVAGTNVTITPNDGANTITIAASGGAGGAVEFVTLVGALQLIDFPDTPAAGDTLTLVLTQDATGGRTAAWPWNVSWDGGTPPTLATGAEMRDVLTFLYSGDDWLGFVSGQFDDPPSPPGIPDITEDFAKTAGVSINGTTTTTGGKTWISPPTGDWLGTSASAALPTVGGDIQTSNASGGMGGAFVASSADLRVAIDYDVSTGTDAYRQARVGCRGGSGTGAAAIIKGDGAVQIEFFGGGGTTTLGAGAATVGTLEIEAVGTSFRVLVNGVQVGSSQTSAVSGTQVGFGTYGRDVKVDNIEVTYL